MTREDFFNKLNDIHDKIKNNLSYFWNKKYASDDDYGVNYSKWVHEVTIKNKIIHQNKNSTDKEMARRRRGEVYWIDFGKNIGSEFNNPHFGVVIYESFYTSVVVPISTKKDHLQNWKENEPLVVDIGKLDDLPKDKNECFALVHQLTTVSKQRLSNYKANGNYHKIKLSNSQMDIIDNALKSICK